MKRWMVSIVLCLAVITLFAACSKGTNEGSEGSANTLPAPMDTAAGVPARPNSDVSGDGSVNLDELMEVSGTVKEINSNMALISLTENGEDYMLRFSEKTTWRENVNTNITAGNILKCNVKPEPTFTTPSQGEVIEVLSNETTG